MQREEDSGSESASCVAGKLIEDVLCCSPISVAMADLLKDDRSLPVEDKRRRVCRFVRSIPPKIVKIRHLVVRVGDHDDIRRKIGLLGEKLLRVLVEIGWRSGVDQKHDGLFGCERWSVLNEIVCLLLAIRTLIARIAAQQDQNNISLVFLHG